MADPFFANLPPGKYSLLLTEEDAKGVVIKDAHYHRSASINPELGHYQSSGRKLYFKNYEKQNALLETNTAIESLHSWIRSKGKDPKLVVCLLKND